MKNLLEIQTENLLSIANMQFLSTFLTLLLVVCATCMQLISAEPFNSRSGLGGHSRPQTLPPNRPQAPNFGPSRW